MPDLGKYAFAVLNSYAVTGVVLGALVVLSLWRSAKVKRALAEAEARGGRSDG